MSKHVLIGVIIAAHGIKGQVKIKFFIDNTENLSNYNFTDHKGNAIKINNISFKNSDTIICNINNINDRNIAEEFIKTKIFITRDQLPDTKKNEFYIRDLIGLSVIDETNNKIGVVTNLYNFGAGDIIEFKNLENKIILSRFTDQNFPKIDFKKNFLFYSNK